MTQDTRAFEMTIEIAVRAEAVWQAITDAQELVRWFPLDANITQGAGGKWMVSWNGQWPWNTDIEIWEPQRRLRLVDRNGRPYDAEGKTALAVTPLQIAIDWHLEAKGGSTTLRLVHSGFGRGGAWDDEYEGVSVGWQLELNGLKHYLEKHRGQTRHVAWNRMVIEAPVAALWNRLVSPAGLVTDPTLMSRCGEHYTTTLSTGDRIEGIVIAAIRDRALEVTVRGWNDALYRLWIDKVGGQSSVNSWLSAYDVAERFITDFHTRMGGEIERVVAKAAQSPRAERVSVS